MQNYARKMKTKHWRLLQWGAMTRESYQRVTNNPNVWQKANLIFHMQNNCFPQTAANVSPQILGKQINADTEKNLRAVL